MPPKSQYVSSSVVLFDIDENLDCAGCTATNKRRSTHHQQLHHHHHHDQPEQESEPVPPTTTTIKRVAIQHGDAEFEISRDDPVLGDDDHSAMHFHRASSCTNSNYNNNHLNYSNAPQQYRLRNQSHARGRMRRASSAAASPWRRFSCCGLVIPVLVLRVVTSLLVMALMVTGLVWKPHVTVAWLSVALACGCSYEYAWLAFRIHYQLLTTYNWYERASPSHDEQDAYNANHIQDGTTGGEHHHVAFQSFASSSFSTFSSHDRDQSQFELNEQELEEQDDDGEVDHTIGGEQGMAARAAKTVASPLDALAIAGRSTAVSSFAQSWCGGREWAATFILSAVLTPLYVLAMHYLFKIDESSFPVALRELPVAAVLFGVPHLTWIANWMACVTVLSTPNVRVAVSVSLQLTTFFAMLLNSLACPVVSIHTCTQPLLSHTELFALGAIAVFALRGLTSMSPADMVVSTMLDLLGFTFIIGGLSLVIGTVDLHHQQQQPSDDNLFARVLLLLVSVLWAAQIAGYACDCLMSHLQLSRYQLLPRRIAVRLGLESTVCALCVAVLTTALGSSVLALPTSMATNVAFALLAVLLARLGALFMGLLRRAAGVKRSGRVLPGLGGLLDMASPVLFAASVFVKLYVVVLVVAQTALVVEDRGAAMEMPANPLSVGFARLG